MRPYCARRLLCNPPLSCKEALLMLTGGPEDSISNLSSRHTWKKDTSTGNTKSQKRWMFTIQPTGVIALRDRLLHHIKDQSGFRMPVMSRDHSKLQLMTDNPAPVPSDHPGECRCHRPRPLNWRFGETHRLLCGALAGQPPECLSSALAAFH